MIYTYTIPGRLPSLNEIIATASHNRYASGSMKRQWTEYCAVSAMQIKQIPIENPVKIIIEWVEPNEKRDLDNVSASIKYILDGLVSIGRLKNDTRQWVRSIEHRFPPTNKQEPHVKVTLEELPS